METLPAEMVATIAQYLTLEELTVCCAVCKAWRESFSHDLLWKPYCTQTLAEYLRTTECIVEPHFVPPQPENSTLWPLGEWRLSYMREVRLWENWRLGRCVRQKFDSSESAHPQRTFLTDDLILRIYGNSVGVWNVCNPPHILQEPMYLFSQWDVDLCQMFGKEKVVVVQNRAVLVFSLRKTSTKWPLDFVFFFDEAAKRPEKNLGDMDVPVDIEEGSYITTVVVVKQFFVGCQKNENTMHIWNLKTGEKLKKETIPIPTCRIKRLEHSETSQDILIISYEKHESSFNFFVFSLNKLKFLPFQAKYSRPAELFNSDSNTSCIHDDYVAIRVGLNLYIHNYKTCQLLKTVNKVVSDPQVLEGRFVYIVNPLLFDLNPFNSLTAYNPSAPNDNLFLTRQNTQRFSIIGGRFYIYDRHKEDSVSSGDSVAGSSGWHNFRSKKVKKTPIEYFERKVWHIHKKRGPMKTKTRVFWFRETANVVANKSCTKVISSNLSDHLSGEEQYWLHTFW